MSRSGEPRGRQAEKAPRQGGVNDIARLAGVGVATVDRVLNERGNVSLETASRVLAAARRLNTKRVLPVSHHKLTRIEALLARPELPLIARMNIEFASLSRQMGKCVAIHRTLIPTENPRAMARAIDKSKANGLVLYAQEHPLIHEAIEAAARRGVPVVTLLSDLPNSRRLAYAGLDCVAAGRTAGYFMAYAAKRPGPVAVLCSHMGIVGHEQRLRGFREALARHGEELAIAEIIEGGDDFEKVRGAPFEGLSATSGFGRSVRRRRGERRCGRRLAALLSRPPPDFRRS